MARAYLIAALLLVGCGDAPASADKPPNHTARDCVPIAGTYDFSFARMSGDCGEIPGERLTYPSSSTDLPAATLPTDDEMRCRVTWSIPGVSGATQMHYASAAACEGDYLLSVTLARDVREVGP